MRKLGRLPARHDKRTLHFGDYADDLGAPPDNSMRPQSLVLWRMFGNDQVGDCTCAGAGNREIEVSAADDMPFEPQDSDIITAYKAVSGWNGVLNDPSDSGCNMMDVLNYWRNTGIAGRKIGAYASVRPTNIRHVKQAVAFLEGLYCGWSLPDAWLNAPAGAVWDAATPNPNNGHCMIVVGYDESGVSVVTWGALQKITWAGFACACDEAYAIASDDMIGGTGVTPAGFNIGQLILDLQAVTHS